MQYTYMCYYSLRLCNAELSAQANITEISLSNGINGAMLAATKPAWCFRFYSTGLFLLYSLRQLTLYQTTYSNTPNCNNPKLAFLTFIHASVIYYVFYQDSIRTNISYQRFNVLSSRVNGSLMLNNAIWNSI